MARVEVILLALETPTVLQLMERALSAAGYKVTVQQDRKGLDSSLQESMPALVMVGETFFGENGLDLCAELRERFPSLPILLYVEKDRDDTAKAVLEAGLSGCLYPPLQIG